MLRKGLFSSILNLIDELLKNYYFNIAHLKQEIIINVINFFITEKQVNDD